MLRKKKDGWRLGVLAIDTFSVVLAAIVTMKYPASDLTEAGIAFISLVHIAIFFLMNFHHKFNRRGYLVEFQVTLKYSFFLLASLVFLNFMLKNDFEISRRGVFFFIGVNFVFIYLTNILIKLIRKRVFSYLTPTQEIFLVTDSTRLSETLTRFEEAKGQGESAGRVVAVAVLDDLSVPCGQYQLISKEDMISYATTGVVDQVFINLPHKIYDIVGMATQFETMGIDVSINIDSLNYPLSGEKRLQILNGYNVVTVSSKFYHHGHIIAKRALDIMGALAGLLLCALAAVIVVPLIKKDGGPAIFSQKRVGKNGRVFNFYKFRSMHVNAEAMKQELMAQNQMDGLMFKMDNDPRITPIGHFIRKTSIDELPQFWNVLRGEMSLVGTRPPTLDEYNQYSPQHKRRLSFKPGITGLWQVSGRSEITDFDEIVKLDVSYIDNWTIWLDIKILFKTVLVVLKREGSK